MRIYRKIYERYYGAIPKDETGRSYDIHHIDGNCKNNDPYNLVALTIKQHYDVHFSQGDYGACWLISRKMDLSAEELSELSKKVQYDRIDKGEHHFIGENNPMKKASREGKHHLSGKLGTNHNKKMIDLGIHPFLGGSIQKDNAKRLIESGDHHSQKTHICPHCNKIGKSVAMFRHHFDRCKTRGLV